MSRRPVLLAVAALAFACAAPSGVSPAAAEPKPAARTQGRTRAPGPISGANADRVQKLWEAAAGARGRAVALSATHGRVAFADENGVSLYELATGKRLASSKPCAELLHRGMAFVGAALIVVCEDAVARFEPKKLGKLPPLPVHASKITAAAFEGNRLALGHHDGIVRIYGLDGAATIGIPVPGPPIDGKSLALSPDGKRVAVAWIQGSIWWWRTDEPEKPNDLVRHESESDSLAWSRDGALLAEEGMKYKTTLWSFDGSTPRTAASVKNGDWVKRIRFSLDGKWLVRGGSDGLELAEIAGPRRVALDTRAPVEDVALDDRGAFVAAADRDGRLSLWAPR